MTKSPVNAPEGIRPSHLDSPCQGNDDRSGRRARKIVPQRHRVCHTAVREHLPDIHLSPERLPVRGERQQSSNRRVHLSGNEKIGQGRHGGNSAHAADVAADRRLGRRLPERCPLRGDDLTFQQRWSLCCVLTTDSPSNLLLRSPTSSASLSSRRCPRDAPSVVQDQPPRTRPFAHVGPGAIGGQYRFALVVVPPEVLPAGQPEWNSGRSVERRPAGGRGKPHPLATQDLHQAQAGDHKTDERELALRNGAHRVALHDDL